MGCIHLCRDLWVSCLIHKDVIIWHFCFKLCMNAPKTQSRLEILITRFETRDSRWKIENLNWPIIYKNHVSERIVLDLTMPRPCLACYNMKKNFHSPCWIIPNLLIPFCVTNPFPLWFSKTISNSFISCLRKRLLC